jgi:hypothetical protein
MKLHKIEYKDLNSRQKEIYNFQKIACTGYLVHPFAKIAIFAFFSTLFAWCMKLERGKSKDVLLALPEKKPQAYEKNRPLLGDALRKDPPKMGERASTGIFAQSSVIVTHLDHPLYC